MTWQRQILALGLGALSAVLALVTPAMGQPSAHQVLTDLGFSSDDQQRVLNGEIVTTDVAGVSDKDLSLAIAFLVKMSPDEVSTQIMTDNLITSTDTQVQASGELNSASRLVLAVLTAAVLLVSAGRVPEAAAEGGESDATKLAKETQNPVANLISVPFQNNFNFGAGPDNKMYWILNFQPVIPISLNDDWNLITRTITPIVQHPSFFSGTDPQIQGSEHGTSVRLGGHQPHGVPGAGEE